MMTTAPIEADLQPIPTNLESSFSELPTPIPEILTIPYQNKSKMKNCRKYFPGYVLAKSTGMCWSPTGTIFYTGKNGVNVHRISIDSFPIDQNKDILKEHVLTMSSHLKNIAIELPESVENPLFSDLSLDTTLESETNLPHAKLIPQSSWSHLNSVMVDNSEIFSDYERVFWKLLPILFDPQLVTPHYNHTHFEQLQEANQNLLFSDWLTEIVRSRVSDKITLFFGKQTNVNYKELTPLEKVKKLLLCHQIDQACIVAIQGGFPRLATLISQAGGDAGFKSHIRRQLTVWVANGTVRTLNVNLIQIYLILAGYIFPNETPLDDSAFPVELNSLRCKITQGLDWINSLALGFWYASNYEDSISKAISNFENAFQSLPDYVNHPKSYYDDKKINFTQAISRSCKIKEVVNLNIQPQSYDSIFQLMKYYSNRDYPLNLVLSSPGFSSLAENRCRWLLANYIRLLNPLSAESSKLFKELTLDFSSQLRIIGLWEWSILVLLHLEEIDVRQSIIKEVLNQYIEQSPSDMYKSFLSGTPLFSSRNSLLSSKDIFLKELGIPLKWLHRSKALKAFHNRDFMNQLQHLLLAEDWTEAHILFFYRLAPQFVFESNSRTLRDVIHRLSSYPLPGWHQLSSGKLFKDYLDIITELQLLLPTPPQIPCYVPDDVYNILNRIQSILDGILSVITACKAKDIKFFVLPPGLAHIDSFDGLLIALTFMSNTLTQYLSRSSSLISQPSIINELDIKLSKMMLVPSNSSSILSEIVVNHSRDMAARMLASRLRQ